MVCDCRTVHAGMAAALGACGKISGAACRDTSGCWKNRIPCRRRQRLLPALCDHIDLLVSCAGISGGETYEKMRAVFNINTLGAVRMTEAFLPLMQTGMKRLAFVSSEAGVISLAHRQDTFTYTMSKTALNMIVRRMFRTLRPLGYTFRLYHPGWVRSYMMGQKSTAGNFEPEETAAVAYRQFVTDRSAEDVLVMTDVSGEMWPY